MEGLWFKNIYIKRLTILNKKYLKKEKVIKSWRSG